jgi:hypothetical protein
METPRRLGEVPSGEHLCQRAADRLAHGAHGVTERRHLDARDDLRLMRHPPRLGGHGVAGNVLVLQVRGEDGAAAVRASVHDRALVELVVTTWAVGGLHVIPLGFFFFHRSLYALQRSCRTLDGSMSFFTSGAVIPGTRR